MRVFGLDLVPVKGSRCFHLASTNAADAHAWMSAIDDNIPERRLRAQKIATFQDCIGFLLLRAETLHDLFRCAAGWRC